MSAVQEISEIITRLESSDVSDYDEQAIRKAALAFNVPCATTITGAEALIEAIATRKSRAKITVRSLQEIHESNKSRIVNG